MKCWRVVLLLFGLVVTINSKKMIQKNRKPDLSGGKDDVPATQWFEQPLDHFDILNTHTWKQRYYAVNEFYQQGGPAFLMLEGEWEATASSVYGYASTEYAKKFKGILFDLEHRFYGQSKPTNDLSIENLKFLSVEQALEDTAFFIVGMNSKYKLPENTKWIVFGGSYAANLAAWMRYKFPHLVYASVAYSGPVLAKLNFFEYKSLVRDTFQHFNKDCLDAVKRAHAQVKAALTGTDDLHEFSKKFRLCDVIDQSKAKDVQSLLEILGDNTGGIVQYNNVWSLTVKDACDIMTNKSLGDFIDRYAEVSDLVLQEDSTQCLDFKYDRNIKAMKDTSWTSLLSPYSERQWAYQSCTEFGYFQTSYKKTHLFSEDIPLEYYIQHCIDVFGEQFDKKRIQHGITRTNVLYGGLNVKATRVVYVNGDKDPWMKLGITTTVLPESPAIIIEGESHCPCVNNLDDENVFKVACSQVEDIVTKWITE